MNHALKKAVAVFFSACLCVGCFSAATVEAVAYDDFEDITGHVTVGARQTLDITVPSKSSISTTASVYYISGGSNPDYTLYMNGEEVTARGKLGSFGVYVGLSSGENTFEFTQEDGSAQTIYITRGKTNSGSGGGGSSSGGSSSTSSLSVGQVVRVTEISSNIFARASTGGTDYLTTAKRGATDYITDVGNTMYKLGMGGWIKKDTVKAVNAEVNNYVSSVEFDTGSGGEYFRFYGTAQPIATTSRSGDSLQIRLHHTSGVDSVPTEGSRLFSGADVTESGDDTIVTLHRNSDYFMWGYLIEYEDNVTTVYAKYQPTPSGGSPLSGIHVVVDGGHGGPDPGALGIMGISGPNEKDITADTAVAVQKRLESLGATVTLVGSGTSTSKSQYTDRMMAAAEEKADFFISLHCNSIGTNQNGIKPNGVEIYYYESVGKNFAQNMLNHITRETGRNSRGVKWSDFRVTLNTCAPSLLVELGFVTNPYDYDDLVSRSGIYNTANAIGDSIVSYLS